MTNTLLLVFYTQIVHKPIHVFFLSFPILKTRAFITFNKSSKIVSESVISCTISWSPLSQKADIYLFLASSAFLLFEVCLSRDRSSYTILVSLSFKCFILSLVLTNAFNTCSCFVTCFDNASNFPFVLCKSVLQSLGIHLKLCYHFIVLNYLQLWKT